MISEDEGLLEEFRSLRTEHTEVQKARLWGAIPYLVIAGGVATLENRVYQAGLLVFLIFAALPFLWHTANRNLADGISLISSNNNTLIRNTANLNQVDGIKLINSDDNILRSNTAKNNRARS